jgi:heterotetrameric sarcosine oxidase gamma subunit
MADFSRKSPLAGRAPWEGRGLAFREVPFTKKSLVFGSAPSPFPAVPNELQGEGPISLLLAPMRWLVFGEVPPCPGLAVADVSDGRVQIDLEGDLVPELLAAGTSVDLDPVAFPVRRAAQTQLARVAALVCRFDAARWSAFVEPSVGVYLWGWLSMNAKLIENLHERAAWASTGK